MRTARRFSPLRGLGASGDLTGQINPATGIPYNCYMDINGVQHCVNQPGMVTIAASTPAPLVTTVVTPGNTVSAGAGVPGTVPVSTQISSPTVVPAGTPPLPTGTVVQDLPGGGTVNLNPAQQITYAQAATAAAIAPQLSPGQGGVPAGPSGSVLPTLPSPGTGPSEVYRFIYYNPSLRVYQTGANLPGCSQTNTALCDAQTFQTLNAAIAYAINRGQIPYMVQSPQEPWGIINGTVQIDPSRIYNSDGSVGGGLFSSPLGLVALVGLAWLVMRRG